MLDDPLALDLVGQGELVERRVEELGRRGYIVHPLQSATKFAWILDHVPDARARAAAGTLRLGTIDSWISWKLSGGACHVTDASNASCTANLPT